MKKIMMLIISLLIVVSLVNAVDIESGDRVYLDCMNADAIPVATAGKITCYDTSGNIDVSNQALTNVATGLFYYTFTGLTDDVYVCFIGCTADNSINYTIPVSIGRVTQVNITDIKNQLSGEHSTISGDVNDTYDALDAVGEDVNTSLENENTIYTIEQNIDLSGNKTVFALEGNSSNWFTSTQQGYLLSNYQAIVGNSTNWFTSTHQNYLSMAYTAIVNNATNWFISTYQDYLSKNNQAIIGNSTLWGNNSPSYSDYRNIAKYVANESANCTAYKNDSIGCTVWSIETYMGR